MDDNMNKAWKKPKVEEDESDMNGGGGGCSLEEQEEALVALIEHRLKEVQHLRLRATYYQSQVAEAEKKLNDSQSKLARLRSASNMARPVSNGSLSDVARPVTDGSVNVKSKRRSASPLHVADEGHSRSQAQTKPRLLIPAVRPKVSAQLVEPKTEKSDGLRPSNPIENVNRASLHSHSSHVAQLKKRDTSGRPMSADPQAIKVQDKDRKRKLGRKEHKDLISSIRTHSSPRLVLFHPSMHISSHHKRKLRTLALNPINDELFVTSALDGIVNLWQLQSKGSGASVLSTTDCASPKQRRWPEDLTWHPDGDRLFAAYSADGGDSQISILNFNSSREKRVTFLEEKPHAKGIINNIVFMPWDDLCFTTGGSDHAVILWHEKEDESSWKPKTIHRNLHSSAVMGIAGLQHKQMIVSVGADKRIVGFDVLAGRAEYKHQIESKCMSVLPNPCDFNLFMVQTAVPERQLRLFDIRLRKTEIHAFGWKQESSESQSALINQAWSPDGFYITSGSADPTIHIFDIRYDSRKPSQSVQAHQKRVFKAVWHHSLHFLVSISSDLNWLTPDHLKVQLSKFSETHPTLKVYIYSCISFIGKKTLLLIF